MYAVWMSTKSFRVPKNRFQAPGASRDNIETFYDVMFITPQARILAATGIFSELASGV